MHKKQAFTLIELLVVISVISLLSSVVFSAANNARARARDARRQADLNSVAKALTLYYDKYGVYPTSVTSAWGVDCGGWRGDSVSGNTFMKPLVDEGFLSNYVKDPRAFNCQYQYRSEKSQQAYRLLFYYELKPNNDASCYQSPAIFSCIRENFDDIVD